MSSTDISYYRERAAAERARASESTSPEVAQAHVTLVTMYENLIDRLERAEGAQDLEPPAAAGQPGREDHQ
jgi:hypothetical protein